MLTYALGRGLEEYDRCAVDQIVKEPGGERVPVLDPGARDRQERPVPEAAALTVPADSGRRQRDEAIGWASRGGRSCEASGTAIALPWLEAMAPGRARGGRHGGRRRSAERMAFLYVPNGVHMPDWTPAGDRHRASRCRPRSQPLEPFQDDLLVLSGLAQQNADALGDGAATTPGRWPAS